jgi:predicted nuclease with RNAse H fold
MNMLGIDLRSSDKLPSTWAVVKEDSLVNNISNFRTDDDLLQLAEEYQPSLIAIGAPLSLPDGLCCLETSCDCQFASPQRKGRQLELELSRIGISCFFTNKGSIIRQLIYRGINLYARLKVNGFRVIEVYPHASKVILFGDNVPSKNSSRSLDFMREKLPSIVRGVDPYLEKIDRGACDALLNAYTALLHLQNATDVLGSPREGQLALPKLVR